MEKRVSLLSLLIKYARPWSLLVGVLFHALGISIVNYLGHSLLWNRLWLGLGMVLLLQLSSYMLKAHFDQLDNANPLLRAQKDLSPEERQALARIPKQGLLVFAVTTLTTGAVLTVIMFNVGAINLPTLIILGIAFLLAYFYAVPPVRLVYSGYGELAESFFLASLVPAFAFLLQTGELHRFLLILSFPLIALYLAMRIALSLESYALDLKRNHKTLLVALGWQRAVTFHNLLIPAAFVLILLANILGLPWPLTWPGLLTVPIGLFQMWQLSQIRAGAKPAWRILRLTASALVGLTAYLLALAFFTV